MKKFMLGRKAGMTQIFNEDGIVIPVTVISCGPVSVVQNKTEEVDGYRAVKVGYEDKKRVTKPLQGQFDKAGLKPKRIMREFKTDQEFELGQEITVADMFAAGDYVDIVGTSKGKGFQGVIKRHGFSRGPESMALNITDTLVQWVLPPLRVKFSKEERCRARWVINV